jgi:hypothetical protein
VNTLFASHLIESKGRLNADEPSRQTTEIEAVSHCKLGFIYFLFLPSHANEAPLYSDTSD